MLYAWIGAGTVVIVLSSMLWLAERENDDLHELVGAMRLNLETASHANDTIRETLAACEEINQSNSDQRELALHRAKTAEGRVRDLENELTESIDNDSFTEEFLDSSCRSLRDPLPLRFRDSLCLDAAANCPD